MDQHVHKFEPSAVAITLSASADVTAGRLLEVTGDGTVAHAGAASTATVGAAAVDTPSGDKVAVLLGGVQPLVASAAITAGDALIAAADGKVAPIGAGTPDQIVGYALTSADNADDLVTARITR
ncbi:DUF2190 family protein [Microbacterium excoecariae]|uniref:DUF2190 family protein n=1 Tax=Microbacterium excoecariae TaxID=2715210 RepID=UPI00140C319A|nr:DUF2190 family protein [Microbacterium excoecariae]